MPPHAVGDTLSKSSTPWTISTYYSSHERPRLRAAATQTTCEPCKARSRNRLRGASVNGQCPLAPHMKGMEMSETGESRKLTKAEVERYYRSTLVNLAQALIDAISTSQCTRNIPSENDGRQYWASVLFARMCGLGVSLQRLLPRSPTYKHGAHWDSTGTLGLCRSVFEAHLAMFYLCTDAMSDADYQLRIRLIFLHDAHERPRIVGSLGSSGSDPVANEFYEREIARLRGEIETNEVYLSLPEPKRKQLLKGRTPYYLSQDELLQRQGEDAKTLRGIWELLSSHVHSYPFSFYRVLQHQDRGTGRENDVDKAYCGLAAQLTASMLGRATEDMKALFPKVIVRRCGIEWDTLTCHILPEENLFVYGMASPMRPEWLTRPK